MWRCGECGQHSRETAHAKTHQPKTITHIICIITNLLVGRNMDVDYFLGSPLEWAVKWKHLHLMWYTWRSVEGGRQSLLYELIGRKTLCPPIIYDILICCILIKCCNIYFCKCILKNTFIAQCCSTFDVIFVIDSIIIHFHFLSNAVLVFVFCPLRN